MKRNRLSGSQLCLRLDWSVALLTALVLCVQGCGGTDGPTTFNLSGNVTFDGKPVPAGQIVFEPDSAAGNSGPQAFAAIRDGKYDTTTGKGTVGGPHVVRITGTEAGGAGGTSEAGPETEEAPTELFSDFQTKADLPKELSTMDFAVTASDVKTQQQADSKPANSGP